MYIYIILMNADRVFLFFVWFLRRCPLEGGDINGEAGFLVLGRFEVLFDQLRGHADHMLTLKKPRFDKEDKYLMGAENFRNVDIKINA